MRDRKTGIDLYRIICMMMVYTTHYFWYGTSGGRYNPSGIDKTIVYFFFYLSLMAVNGYILVSGYFSSVKDYKEFGIRKPVCLLFELIILNMMSFLIKVLFNIQTMSIIGAMKSILPQNYFTILFCALYLIMPFLNAMIQNLPTGRLVKLVIVTFLLFSVYTTIIDQYGLVSVGTYLVDLSTIGRWGSGYGYTIVQFTMMYLIGSLIRRCDDEGIAHKCLDNRLLLICIVIANSIIVEAWTFFAMSHEANIIWTSCEYCNPLIIINSVSVFLMLRKVYIKYFNGIVFNVSKTSYVFFLVHVKILKEIQIIIWSQKNLVYVLITWLFIGIVLLFISCFVSVILHWFEQHLFRKMVKL